MENLSSQKLRYSRFCFANLLYTVAVIVWGAFVRAASAGAGCGAHWPLCNGEVIPTNGALKTLIEFTHRTTSGISLILVIIGWWWARRLGEKGSGIRKLTNISVIAIVLEALLGAALVLLKLVEFDQSISRAISISLHLVNTLFLIASLTLILFYSRRQFAYQKQTSTANRLFPRNRGFLAALGLFVLLGISGAIAALGDTLFKVPSLSQGMAQDFSATAHFLIRLRIIHPILAISWIVIAFVWSHQLITTSLLKSRNVFLSFLTLQFLIGLLNWLLLAPTALQLLHLAVANAVFISFIYAGLKQHET